MRSRLIFDLVQRGLKPVDVAGVVLQQVDDDVEADDESLIFIGKNLLQEGSADLFLHVQHVFLASAGVDHDTQGEGQVRLCREVLDGLRFAVFVNLEIVFGEVGDQRAMLIFDIEEKLDHVDVDFEGLGRLLRIVGLLVAGPVVVLAGDLGRTAGGRLLAAGDAAPWQVSPGQNGDETVRTGFRASEREILACGISRTILC